MARGSKPVGRWVVCRVSLISGAGGVLGPVWDSRRKALAFAHKVGAPYYKTTVIKLWDGN